MDIGYIVFLGLALGVIPSLALIILRVIIRSDPYQFEIVQMKPGVNDHFMTSGDSLEFEHEHNGKRYEVKSDRLYRVKVGRVVGLWFYLRGIKKRFLIVFQHEKTEPITAGDVAVSTRVLRKVNESKALGKALRSQFAVPFDMKKILLIMGFVVVVVIAYVLVTGEVAI